MARALAGRAGGRLAPPVRVPPGRGRGPRAPAPGAPGRGLLLGAAAKRGDLHEGALVAVRGNKALRPLVLTGPEGKRNWRAQDSAGHALTLRPAEVLYVLPPGLAGDPGALGALQRRAEAEAEEGLLQLAWETLEPRGTYGVEELAEALFDARRPEECYVAFYLLATDRVYFKKKGGLYEARPAEQVAQLRAQAEAERAQEARVAQFAERARAAAARPFAERPSEREWLEGEDGAAVRALQASVVAFGEGPERREVDRLAQACGYPKTVHSVLRLLKDIGAWGPHELVHTRRLGVTAEFPPACAGAAGALDAAPPPDPDAAGRRDLRHLKVLTIDDPGTREIDDGLSVEFLGGGRTRVWVHIADPTRFVPLGSPLDLEARARGTTVYLPTGPVPMFPFELASGAFSLNAGTERCAMSVAVDLDAEGGVEGFEAAPTLVAPSNLSYEEADARFRGSSAAEEPELHALFRLAEARHAARRANGAVNIFMPELEVVVRGADREEPEVSVSFKTPEAFMNTSRSMVAEMMILANEALGRIGDDAGVPLPYRGQAAPVLPPEEELARIPEGPPRAAAVRRCFTRGLVSTAAAIPHGSLGLGHYVQFTSPIRRYGDVLAHYQIKAHLRGEAAPFTASQLQALMDEVADAAFEKRKLMREAEDYFIAMFFRDNPRGVWSGQFLQWVVQDRGLASVLIEDLGYEVRTRIDRAVLPGDRISLEVVEADPRLDGTTSLKFELAEEYEDEDGEGEWAGEWAGEGEEEGGDADGYKFPEKMDD